MFVAASNSERPAGVGSANWDARVTQDLHAGRWTDNAVHEFETADRWATRLLARVPGARKSLVLVTGDVPPEKWVRQPPFHPTVAAFMSAEPWRRKLSDVGEYWDAEKVGAAVAAAGAQLLVVAPEARFGDFLPLEEIPQAPWASRPQTPATIPLAAAPPATTPGEDDGQPLSEEAIRAIEKEMREKGLPEEVIRQAIEKLRNRKNSHSDIAPDVGAGRFESATPLWFPSWGQQRFFNADTPSAYGSWPLARAAAKTGGAYCFYPFAPAKWLDACPRDASLIDAMEPELVSLSEFAHSHAADEALAAMIEAQKIVFDSTPWTDASRGFSRGGASSWCGFDAPDKPAVRWRPREKPFDDLLLVPQSMKSWKQQAAKLAPVVEDYDRACRVLGAAQAQLAAGTLRGASRRSQANLRMCRFWFEMSAFHLDALRLYLSEIERFMPPGADERNVLVTYTTAFRMSDCLDAYDGRTISAADEKRYGYIDPATAGGTFRGYQGHLLAVPPSDPNYRAKRDSDDVFFRVDPRLLPRALRVVDAGRDVMTHEARSAWGWTAYYAEPHTYVWVPVTGDDGRSDRHGDPADPPPPPYTPGSGGGGPGTPK